MAARLSLVLYLGFSCLRPASATWVERQSVDNSSDTGFQEVFQVGAPLRDNFEGFTCQQVIVDHEFAASYGTPYVGTYSPPEDCEFTTVIFNMSIKSVGINYDRLGSLLFGDTGIYWNYQKDMTVWTTLLKEDQKVIMEMDNIYDTVFTGAYNVTITALYYNDAYAISPTPADIILPLSSLSGANNESSVVSLPDGNATLLYALPRNAERAVVSILASGNGAEEFWYFRVPSQFASTFANVTLTGHSPFREVQLLIDGQLAGVSWPFPIVYTGGINPALWVPVVGVDAFDVPSFEIDITPWLGLLCDGVAHNFTMAVVGYDTTTLLGTTNSNWYISGSIFVWVDNGGNQTTSSDLVSHTPLPEFDLTSSITTTPDGTNTSLSFQLLGTRNLSHSANITTSKGSRLFSWSQNLIYSHNQFREGYTAYTGNSTIYQITNGSAVFTPYGFNNVSDSDQPTITNTFQYPIAAVQVLQDPVDVEAANSSLYGAIDRSVLSTSMPILSYLTTPSIFSSSPQKLATRQYGSATEYWNDTYYEDAGAIDPAKGSSGTTQQWYSFEGPLSDGFAAPSAFGQYVETLDGYETALLVNQTYDTTISVPQSGPLTLPL